MKNEEQLKKEEQAVKDVRKVLSVIPKTLLVEALKGFFKETMEDTVKTQSIKALTVARKGFDRSLRTEHRDGPITAINLLVVEALFLISKRVLNEEVRQFEGLYRHLQEARKHLSIAENITMIKMSGNAFKAIYGKTASTSFEDEVEA